MYVFFLITEVMHFVFRHYQHFSHPYFWVPNNIRYIVLVLIKQLLEENIRKVKLSTPDYRDMDPERAIADFKQRREMYMQVYEPVDTSDGPHIKIVNSREFIGTEYIFSS